ncbi:MAG: PEP-CTERM sorting domain-containing protein [Opitutia bacterium]|jgi:MYXO-CTERM domain-containing protein
MRCPCLILSVASLAAGVPLGAQETLYPVIGNLGGGIDHTHSFNSYGGFYAQAFTTGQLPPNVDADGNGVPLFFLRWQLTPGLGWGFHPETGEFDLFPSRTVYRVDLRADNGGLPGQSLMDWAQIEVFEDGVVLVPLSGTVPQLQSNTTYWAAAAFVGGDVVQPPAFRATDGPVTSGSGAFGDLVYGESSSSFFGREGRALLSMEYEYQPAAVPEPSAAALGLGALGLACLLRRRRR